MYLHIIHIFSRAVSHSQAFLLLRVDVQGVVCRFRLLADWTRASILPLSHLSFTAPSPVGRTAPSRHGRSPSSRCLPVHRYAGGRGRAALPPGPHRDLPVWCSLLEETPHPIQGTFTANNTCLKLLIWQFLQMHFSSTTPVSWPQSVVQIDTVYAIMHTINKYEIKRKGQ